MQTLLNAKQMHDADLYTIRQKSISSIELMETAALAFVKVFEKEVKDLNTGISILCGQGNNGGDGLAIARLLNSEGYNNIKVYLINFSSKQSDDYTENLKRLGETSIEVEVITKGKALNLSNTTIVVDAILGSGLNKPLTGEYEKLAKLINDFNKKVIAVDVPTGFTGCGEIIAPYKGIYADLVISFQLAKVNFFFPESVNAFNNFKVVGIGLSEEYIAKQNSFWKLTEEHDVKQFLKPRKKFSHKGTYGHAAIIAGNNATMGAALLSASACLHAGAGLTTMCLPQSGLIALNTLLPEVMAMPRNEFLAIEAFEKFSAIAFGPGLGVEEENEILLEKLINLNKPLIIDADGLTLLSNRNDLFDILPAQSILTPHLKEFDRIFGTHFNWYNRVETARMEAIKRNIIIVLKNQYTFICLPTGDVYINPTGNPAMASGGMGDVLTGIITAFVAQGYGIKEAVILAVYLHGKAGDELAADSFTVTASQVALQLPKTIKRIFA